MGSKLSTILASNNTNIKLCTDDSDCHAASTTPSYAAATTTTEKAKRCCMRLEYHSPPSGTYE